MSDPVQVFDDRDQADVVLALEWCDLGGLYSRPGSRGAAASDDHQRRRGACR
jgi:hypothetical protein